MDPVSLDKAALKAQFGLSERLAVRILALRRKGLGATEALLEEAKRRAEIGELLLSQGLLDSAESLDGAGFSDSFSQRHGLTVVSTPKGRVLALEEEVLADETESPAPRSSAIVRDSPGAPAAFHFGPQDLEAMKLTILTSVDSAAKIEAIRKLAHADAPSETRGSAFLRALMDPDTKVRVEALGALQRVGLDPILADALRGLHDESVARKRMALERVVGRFESASEAERSVILSCLLSELAGSATPVDLLPDLASAIEPFSPWIGASADRLAHLTKTLLRALADHYHSIKKAVVRLFEALSPHVSEAGALTLHQEIEAVGDRRLKALFMGLLSRVSLPASARDSLARAVAQVMSTSFGEEIEARDLLEVGRRLGDAQVAACVGVVDRVGDEYLPNFIRSLDFIAGSEDVSPARLVDVAEVYLRLVQNKGKLVRMTLLESPLFFHARVPAASRAKFAEDLISNLHLYRLDRQIEQIEAVLLRIGPSALPALRHAAAKSPHEVERRSALKLIPATAGEQASEALDFLEKLEKDKAVPVGPLAVCTARVAAHPSVGHDRALRVYRSLRERLGRPGESFDLILAMGHLAASASVPSREGVELALELVSSLEGKLPDPQVSTVQTEDGPRITFGRETLTYTEFVPNVLTALRRIYESDRLPTGIRIMVARRLLKRWETVVSFQEVWAPGNLVELAETLALISRHPATPPDLRDETARALVRHARNTTVARVLSDTLVFHDEEAEGYVAVVEQFGRMLMEMAALPDFQNPDDRRLILGALGRLAAHAKLARTKKESEELRERIADLLVEQLTPSFREGYRLLRALSTAKHSPPALRRRLSQVVGES